MTKAKLISLLFSSFCLSLYGQTSVKLSADRIIGTTYSVDYDNGNNSSLTVNAKKNAFDGDLNTFFASYDRSNTWVGLDLGEKHVITKIAYCPRPGWPQRTELGIFEGANNPDFGDAIILYMITEQPKEGIMTQQEIKNSRGFRYVRYVGPNDVRCNIAELEFYGYPNSGNDSGLIQITNIPDVIIHTVNARDITSKTEYVKGIVSFVSENGKKIFTDSLEIRGRGNASWGFEKKPYRIKLSKKTKLLGNKADARNWTLISNHGDKTLMRNLLAFDLSKRFEMPYTPAGQPVNVYLNGEYKGCYQLCDHIDVRENRVDVKEMKTTDVSGGNLTGGYLIEIDAYAYSGNSWFESQRNAIPVTIKSPDSDEIVSQQFSYIRNYFNTLESVVFSTSYANPETGFRKYMDTKTFVRHFLVGEFSGNTDTYWSVFMYKQRNEDKFYFGPVWDFDIAYDNDSRTYPVNNKRDFIYRSGGSYANGMLSFADRIIYEPKLYKEIRDTWAYYRDYGVITEENLLKVIDNYATQMDASQKLNFKRWNVLNSWVHMINHNTGSYQGEVNIVKEYTRQRIKWMDEKLQYIPNPNGILQPDYVHLKVYPNPAKDWIRISGFSGEKEMVIYDMHGRIFTKKYIIPEEDISLTEFSKGIYLIKIDGNTLKLVKD